MMKRIFFALATLALLAACEDDDSFSTSTSLRLTMASDTLSLDTVFSQVPSSTYAFWVYNRHDKGIRLTSVRLKHGNQTGFRVNVDGEYLDNTNGAQVNNIELRAKDSLLVFVELTAAESGSKQPQRLEEQLLFHLENGIEQQILLEAWTWDAKKLYSPVIDRDSTIQSDTPIIIYGGITVTEGAVLNLKGTSLFFHDGAGIDVYGSLKSNDCLLRGDRLDRMFDYLPYDRVSAQWKGIHFYGTSKDNTLIDTEIRNPIDALVCDSAMLDSTIVRLNLLRCIVHNCGGAGITATNANISLEDCQITNTQNDCLNVTGGITSIKNCTIGQFYPFDANRGAALRFSNRLPLICLSCEGSILTGYDDDVLMGELVQNEQSTDNIQEANFWFSRSLLRTPKVETADSLRFSDIIWESKNDSIEGKKHFLLIDEKLLQYDFHLDSLSTAKGLGCYR